MGIKGSEDIIITKTIRTSDMNHTIHALDLYTTYTYLPYTTHTYLPYIITNIPYISNFITNSYNNIITNSYNIVPTEEDLTERIEEPLLITEIQQAKIQEALENKELCPILYEPLQEGETVITACLHIFSRAGFEACAALAKRCKKSLECPMCRQETRLYT